jgi:hypothetical protein
MTHHEQFQRDLNQLLTAQVIQKSQIDDLLKVTQENTRQMELSREKDATFDARVDKLVWAIGEFISRLPPVEHQWV